MIGQLYRLLLHAYPKTFRERFGPEMRQVFRDRWHAVPASQRLRFLFNVAKDLAESAIHERTASMMISRGTIWRAYKGFAVGTLTLVLGLLAATPFLEAFVIPTSSMEGSLLRGDHLVVHKLGLNDAIRQGDMIAFRYPEDRTQNFVKRVIGVPGDHIRLVNKQVIRNGRRLVEPYALHKTSYIDAYRDNFPATEPDRVLSKLKDMLASHLTNGEVIVPEGSYFVLGDNRDASLDSRYWGFVPRADIIGRGLLVYWSYDANPEDERMGGLPKHFFTRTRWGRTLHLLGTASASEVTP